MTVLEFPPIQSFKRCVPHIPVGDVGDTEWLLGFFLGHLLFL